MGNKRNRHHKKSCNRSLFNVDTNEAGGTSSNGITTSNNGVTVVLTSTDSRNEGDDNRDEDEYRLVQTDFGTPPKKLVNSSFVGRKFLYIFEGIQRSRICEWIGSPSRNFIVEDYVTVMIRFSMLDVLGSLSAASTFYRYIESDRTTSYARQFVVVYVAYCKPDTLSNKMANAREQFTNARILVAEVLSASTLLRKMSVSGPLLRSTISATRLDPVRLHPSPMEAVDSRLLGSLESFVRAKGMNTKNDVNPLQIYEEQFTSRTEHSRDQNVPLRGLDIVANFYAAQMWTTTCFNYAITTNTLRYRNIGLVGRLGSGKSYIVNKIIDANDEAILCIVPDVLEKRIVDTVENYHKLVIFDGVTVHQLRQIPRTLDNLLERCRPYPIRREDEKTKKTDATFLCSIIAFETDNVSELLASTFFHKCGTIIAFSPLKINENGNLRPLRDDDEDWSQFTRTRIYVPHTLVPGRVEDLLPENKSE